MNDFFNKLVDPGMEYSNLTSPWAWAPLLVPKTGLAKFCFTFDLRQIIRYMVKHQFSMSIIDQELTKLAGSQYYATFFLSLGNWKVPLLRSCRLISRSSHLMVSIPQLVRCMALQTR